MSDVRAFNHQGIDSLLYPQTWPEANIRVRIPSQSTHNISVLHQSRRSPASSTKSTRTASCMTSVYASASLTSPRSARGRYGTVTGSCGTRVRRAAFVRILLGAEPLHPVVFRMTVFRPFPSEVILAKVKSSDEDGIRRTSLGFSIPLPPLIRQCAYSDSRVLRRHIHPSRISPRTLSLVSQPPTSIQTSH